MVEPGIVITKGDLRQVLALSSKNTNAITKLLDVKDKQNVPLSTDLLLSFSDGIRKLWEGNREGISVRLDSVIGTLTVFSYILDGVLAYYSDPGLTLSEQLEMISTAMHILFSLQRSSSIIPNQLYHDLMSTFQNSFLVAAKFQLYGPDHPCYLMLTGTDVLERMFGNCRNKLGHNTTDCLGMVNMARSLNSCSAVLESHPDWASKSHRNRRLALDYSNPEEWIKENLITRDLDLYQLFRRGKVKAEFLLQEKTPQKDNDFSKLHREECTFLRPKGKLIGLAEEKVAPEIKDKGTATVASENTTSPSVDETAGTSSESTATEPDGSLTSYIEDPVGKHSPTVMVEGSGVHFKATVVKEIFSSDGMSKDRLKRVRAYSRLEQPRVAPNLDDLLKCRKA